MRLARLPPILPLLAACHGPTPRAAPPAPRPVVVVVVVDQFAAWIADERLPRLPPDGGFARLLREGTWYRRLSYAHAVTDTAPGHAALYAGAPPRETGIPANELLDAGGKKRSLFADARASLVGADDRRAPGASLAPLRTPVLADRLRAAHPDAVILSLSLKDRSALLGGGRRPDAALWYSVELGEMVTSTALAPAVPDWARALGTPAALAARAAHPWTVGDPVWTAAVAGGPDDAPVEADLAGYGTTFPHLVPASARPERAFRLSPAADELLLDLALAGLDASARRGGPVLLALSLSANDYIGHAFGPRSWESVDELRRLDRALASFMEALDRRYGAHGWAMLLTADHGVVDHPGTLIDPASFVELLEFSARQALGPGPWLLGLADPYLIFSLRARALGSRDRTRLVAAVTTTLRADPRVQLAVDAAAAPSTCPPEAQEDVAALVCRSLVPGAIDGVYIALAPGNYFDPDVVPGSGVSHGTPWGYDRTVPLLVRAPGREAAGVIVERRISYREVARRAAALLGLP